MIWQSIVFALQILLIVGTWLLYQQAISDLNARAAETPVLGEVRALQRNIRQLLQELQTSSDQTSAALERKFSEARELLDRLDERMSGISALSRSAVQLDRAVVETTIEAPDPAPKKSAARSKTSAARNPRTLSREKVYQLADKGETLPAIAQTTGLSEGEVETLLGLRSRRS